MCAVGVIHSIGDYQDIRFMGGMSVYMPFTSCLMVSNFALCSIPFLTGFYSRDFILEMFSMRYINIFGFFLLFLFTGLTVWQPSCTQPQLALAVLHIICSSSIHCSPDDGSIDA
jgi:NADH:ubiquinone oxidoreductase subunit 5 (subunit L)/multisubunit Na+/H+ antiporter MnhA subunit